MNELNNFKPLYVAIILVLALIAIFGIAISDVKAGYPGQNPVHPCLNSIGDAYLLMTLIKNNGNTGQDILTCKYTISATVQNFEWFCNQVNPPQFYIRHVFGVMPDGIEFVKCVYVINNFY